MRLLEGSVPPCTHSCDEEKSNPHQGFNQTLLLKSCCTNSTHFIIAFLNVFKWFLPAFEGIKKKKKNPPGAPLMSYIFTVCINILKHASAINTFFTSALYALSVTDMLTKRKCIHLFKDSAKTVHDINILQKVCLFYPAGSTRWEISTSL